MKSTLNILLVTALAVPLLVLTGCGGASEPGDKLGGSYFAQ